jgi:hypothetical protein
MKQYAAVIIAAGLIGGVPAMAQSTMPDHTMPGQMPDHPMMPEQAAPPAGGNAMAEPTEPNGAVNGFLRDAQAALDRHQTGYAQEALEKAETRLLDRSVSPDQVGTPNQDPTVRALSDAREALRRGDMRAARAAMEQARADLRQMRSSQGG